MVIKYFYCFFFVLATVTWACYIDSQESNDILLQLHPLNFLQVISEALKNPKISSQISSSSHAILSSFSSQNEFYNFVLQNYDFRKHGFDSEDPLYWDALVNISFRDFSRQQAEQAQVIMNQIVLPHNPFLSQVLFSFHINHFLDQFIPDIDFFLDQAAKNIFAEQFSQILLLENYSEAQILLKAFLRKAKNIICNDPEYKYHHAFLVNVPFQYFKGIHLPSSEYYSDISSYISHLAPALYRAIIEHSKAQADEILAGILPSRYFNLTNTTYDNTIKEYQESSQQPIDHSYLWDPQIFSSSLLTALQTSIIEDSHFAPYLTMLKFSSQDSPLAYLFRHYIAQNYYQPSNLQPEDLSLFLRSIIFSSFFVFSSLLPNHSKDIIQLLFPTMGMDQIQSQFVHGLVNDQFSSDVHFPLVAGWGHTSTVQLILVCRTDISARTAGSALAFSAQGGHTSIANLLLQCRADISAYDAGLALRNSAHGGYTAIANFLLQSRVVISAYDAGSALALAAHGGHTDIVNLLLQSRANISADEAGSALAFAAQSGHTLIIVILIHFRSDISTHDVGSALAFAAHGGYTDIIKVLLQFRTDISAIDVGRALRNSAQGGYTAIIDIILQFRADISSDAAGLALRNAAQGGHSAIVKILLQGRPDISADDAGDAIRAATRGGYAAMLDISLQRCVDTSAVATGDGAIQNAANDEYATIIEIILQRRADISADYAGSALQYGALIGHTAICDIIFQRCPYISVFDAGCALRNAAQGGHTAIVDILLQGHVDISTDATGRALCNAAQGGHADIVNLLIRSRFITADHACMALCGAIEGGHDEILKSLQAEIESRY